MSNSDYMLDITAKEDPVSSVLHPASAAAILLNAHGILLLCKEACK